MPRGERQTFAPSSYGTKPLMELSDYLRALRRRKLVLLAVIMVAAVAGWLTAPGSGAEPTEYTASHTLATSLVYPENFNLDQAALLVTAGDIPVEVAGRFGRDVDPLRLVEDVASSADADLGTLVVRAKGTDPERTERIADLFAEELLAELSDSGRTGYEASLDGRQSRVEELQAEIDYIVSLLPAGVPADGTFVPPAEQQLRNELASTTARFDSAVDAVDQLRAAGPPPVPLATLEAAMAVPATNDGFEAPQSKVARSLLLAMVGLFVGIALALAADRLDTRLRTATDTGRAFGLPVIAEIPRVKGGRRNRRAILTVSDPSSPIVEAHRALRTVLLFGIAGNHADPGATGVAANGQAAASNSAGHKVILVTSPCPSEGKTTTVAHLASVLAEAGKLVLAVSADFRRPCLHEFFGVDREPGLTDLLSGRSDAPALADLVRRTAIPGLSVLTAGGATANPAKILPEAKNLLRAARECFDFVLVDAAPLLAANDAAELAQAVDIVLVQARSGQTTRAAASAAAEMLSRVNAPVIGAVLVGADEPVSKYGHRYYRQAGDPLAGSARSSANEGSGETLDEVASAEHVRAAE